MRESEVQIENSGLHSCVHKTPLCSLPFHQCGQVNFVKSKHLRMAHINFVDWTFRRAIAKVPQSVSG
jgi:hypothetical protein